MGIREGGVVEQCAHLKYLNGENFTKISSLKIYCQTFFFPLFLGCYKTSVRTTKAKNLEVSLNV